MQRLFSLDERQGFWGLWHFGLPYVAMLLGFLASLLIILVFPAAGENSTLSGRLTGEPLWLPEIVAGFVLGRFVYETLPSKIAFAAWLPPACFLLWSAWSWQNTMAVYDSTWDTYFGRNCGGSECLYQLFLTAPFYTSISYSIGALSKYIAERKAERLSNHLP